MDKCIILHLLIIVFLRSLNSVISVSRTLLLVNKSLLSIFLVLGYIWIVQTRSCIAGLPLQIWSLITLLSLFKLIKKRLARMLSICGSLVSFLQSGTWMSFLITQFIFFSWRNRHNHCSFANISDFLFPFENLLLFDTCCTTLVAYTLVKILAALWHF